MRNIKKFNDYRNHEQVVDNNGLDKYSRKPETMSKFIWNNKVIIPHRFKNGLDILDMNNIFKYFDIHGYIPYIINNDGKIVRYNYTSKSYRDIISKNNKIYFSTDEEIKFLGKYLESLYEYEKTIKEKIMLQYDVATAINFYGKDAIKEADIEKHSK